MLRVQPTAQLGALERETLRNMEKDGIRDTQFVKSNPEDLERARERGWDQKLLAFNIPDTSPQETFEAVLDSLAGFIQCSQACAYFYKEAVAQGVTFHFGREKGAFDGLVEETVGESKKAIGLKTKDGTFHKSDITIIAGKFSFATIHELANSNSGLILNATVAGAVVPHRVFGW